MSKMVQVRNVPDELHRALKVRAAQSGMTLSDYILAELEGIAEKPTWPSSPIGSRRVSAAKSVTRRRS